MKTFTLEFFFPLNKGYMRVSFSIIICLCLFLSLCIFCISHCIIPLVLYRQSYQSTQSNVYIYQLMYVDGDYLQTKKVYHDSLFLRRTFRLKSFNLHQTAYLTLLILILILPLMILLFIPFL